MEVASSAGSPTAKPNRPSIADVLRVVARCENASPYDILSAQTKELSTLRGLTAFLGHKYARASFTELGRELNGCDRTTILYWCETIAKRVAEDPSWAARVDGARAALAHEFDLDHALVIPEPRGQALRAGPSGHFDFQRRGPSAIAAIVAESQGIGVEDVMRGTTPELCFARGLAMYLTRLETDLTLREIGLAFGMLDHTSPLHWCQKLEREAARDGNTAAGVTELRTRARRVVLGFEEPPRVQQKSVSPQVHGTVLSVVASSQRLSLSDIYEPRREPAALFARQIAMYLLRRMERASYPRLQQTFGLGCHKTAMAACRHIEELIGTDEAFATRMTGLVERIAAIQRGAQSLAPVVDDALPPLLDHRAPRRHAEGPGLRDVAEPIRTQRRPVPLKQRAPKVRVDSELGPWAAARRDIERTLRPQRVMVAAGGHRVPLADLVAGPRGTALLDALAEVYLIDRLTGLDAQRLGLTAARNAALAKVERDPYARKVNAALRLAIEPCRDAVMSHVGVALQADRQRRFEQTLQQVAFA